MADKHFTMQDTEGNNIYPQSDYNDLLNVPSNILTTKDIMMTQHSLTMQNQWQGSGKVVTFQLGGIVFVGLHISCHTPENWTAGNNPAICLTPDISKDAAVVAGGNPGMEWKYWPALDWNIVGTPMHFAFHDGYGYLNVTGGNIPKNTRISVEGVSMLS